MRAAPALVARSATRKDVQGLRAVAVLAVMFDHLVRWPTGGFVGVDVFFVISGYLITGILLRTYERTGKISFSEFYVRRARRILPASALVIAATVLASVIFFGRNRAIGIVVDGIWASLFSANWRMAISGTDYFQLGLPPSPLQHYWSLGVEEQFYFVWPALLFAVLILVASRGWLHKHRRTVVIATLGLLIAVSLSWAFINTAADPNFAYFSTLTRGWELAVGALVAAAIPAAMRVPNALRIGGAWLGLGLIVASVFLLNDATPFPAPGALLPVVGAALILVAGSHSPERGYDLALAPITNRVMGYLGDISYSLYLWHFPVLSIALAFVAEGTKTYIIGCLVVTLALSVLSYHFIESPVRKSQWLAGLVRGHSAKTRAQTSAQSSAQTSAQTSAQSSAQTRERPRFGKLLAIWIPVAAAGTVLVVAIVATGTTPWSAQGTPTDNNAPVGPPVTIGDCFGAAAAGANWISCAGAKPAEPLTPAPDGMEADTRGAFSCWRNESANLKTCRYGSTKPGALRIALVGDSHAAMLFPALKSLLLQNNWTLDTYLGWGCQWRDQGSSNCGTVMQQVQTRLTDPRHPYDLVITTAARWTADPNVQVAARSFAKLWAPVAALGSSVVVVGDVPQVAPSALQCVSRVGFDPATTVCSTQRAVAEKIPDPLPVAARLVPSSTFVDLTDYFCNGDVCPVVIGNVIAYRDSASHMTGTYSTTLAPYLLQLLNPVIAARAK